VSSQFGSSERVLVTGGSGFIGTNTVQALRLLGVAVLSLDVKEPRHPEHHALFCRCDILDWATLNKAFVEFLPQIVIHLAARTDLAERGGLKAYAANIEGVENMLKVVREVGSVRRVLFASSKLVNKNGAIEDDTTAFTPDTLYGQSKVLGEKIVRARPPACDWAILRPTSIWGPWFGAPYLKFFKAVAHRTYFNVAGCDLQKRFGYVGNAVAQILAILQCRTEQMNGETFYLADYETTTIRLWADEISMQLRGKRNPSAPDWIIELAALGGDVLKSLGMAEPPLSSFRLRNLRTPTAETPLENTMKILHELPYSQEEGVHQTLEWLHYSQTHTN